MAFERLNYNLIAPEGMKRLAGVYEYVGKSSVDPDLVHLVFLRVSQINGCAYCVDLHTRDLIKAGTEFGKLALVSVWREAGNVFDAKERAALAWAETVTDVAKSHVSDEDYKAALAVFSERELVDLTLAVSLMNAYNRMAISFRARPAQDA